MQLWPFKRVTPYHFSNRNIICIFKVRTKVSLYKDLTFVLKRRVLSFRPLTFFFRLPESQKRKMPVKTKREKNLNIYAYKEMVCRKTRYRVHEVRRVRYPVCGGRFFGLSRVCDIKGRFCHAPVRSPTPKKIPLHATYTPARVVPRQSSGHSSWVYISDTQDHATLIRSTNA